MLTSLVFPKSLDPNKKEVTVKDYETKSDDPGIFFKVLGAIFLLAVMTPIFAIFVYSLSGSVALAGISPMAAFFLTLIIFCR